MRRNYFKYTVWAVVAALAALAAPVFTGMIHTGRIDVIANYWPWMAMGGILIVLTAIARCARRCLPSEARI